MEGRCRGAGADCPHGKNKHTDRRTGGRGCVWPSHNIYHRINQLTPLSLPILTPLAAFPSDDEAITALASVAKDIKTVDAWHLQFELLTTIRRLALHHPDSLDKKTCSSVIVPFVTEKVRGGGGGGGGGGPSPCRKTG